MLPNLYYCQNVKDAFFMFQIDNFVTCHYYISEIFQIFSKKKLLSVSIHWMAYFYSQKMSYCECMMPRQIAWQVVTELGTLQIIHFENTVLNYQNPFIKNFKRCDQSNIKLKQIMSFIREVKPDFKLIQPQSYKQALSQFDKDLTIKSVPGHLYINDIEDQIDEIHKYLHRQQKELQHLQKQEKILITNASLLLAVSNSQQVRQIYLKKKKNDQSDFYQVSDKNQTSFDFRCFMINRKAQMIVQKGLFRITRGNIWIDTLETPQDRLKFIFPKIQQNLSEKVCLLIIFQKGQSKMVLQKIQKFMSCIQTNQLQVPYHKWQSELKIIQSKAKQIHNLQQLTIQSVQRYLYKLYESREGSSMSRLKYLQIFIKKQTVIYRQLSSMITSKNFFHFNIYVPSKDLPIKIHPNANLPPLIMIPKNITAQPPSKFDTPQLLQIPQVILNTYGVPSYMQYNPAITYIITFGFFIGVMFGDVGHMLMAIPLLLYFKANIWMWSILFWMGYCGLIYNQFFGLDLGLFQSCYYLNLNKQITRTQNCVYSFGIDSIWQVTQNRMQYTNSLKMKVAVIIGVVHMMLGLCIRFLNGMKAKNYVDIFLLSLPQTIFMICTFVYMDYLIIYKWFQQYVGEATAKAPSIISTMIAIFAQFGSEEGPTFWPGQRQFQKGLVVICILMIPIMLLGKPVYIWLCRSLKHNNIHEQIQGVQQYVKENLSSSPRRDVYQLNSQFQKQILQQISSEQSFKKQKQLHTNQGHSNESLKQVFVHQFIQTIQYVLGTVSNTASYLRLWALSLAHGQLSQVIFELILLKMIKGGYSSILGTLIAFPFFFLVTFGVLICMDSMECFLHSLRLHWVQFQNKFYKGNGYQFKSFNFKSIGNQPKGN